MPRTREAGRPRRRRRNQDGGYATIWAAGACAALVLVAALMLSVGGATIARHRVTAAADLSALAAAGQAPGGKHRACERAEWVAERMGGRLVSCRFAGWDVFVRVSMRPPGILAGLGATTARARAGPANVDRPR